MALGNVFCDDCGKDISGAGQQYYSSALKHAVASACAGESAALCKACNKKYKSHRKGGETK